MAELLVAGTFWFWLLIALEFMVLIWCLEYEQYFLAPVTIGVLLVAMYFFGNLSHVCQWIFANKFLSLGLFAGYFLVVGAPYSVIKWWSFVRDIREKNREEKKAWLSRWQQRAADLQNKIDSGRKKNSLDRYTQEDIVKFEREKAIWEASQGVMTADLLVWWKEHEKDTYVRDFFGRVTSIGKPEPEHYKGRIVSWIVYWPPSMFWTLLNDPIRKIGRAIYNWISATLKRISDHAWKDEDKLG